MLYKLFLCGLLVFELSTFAEDIPDKVFSNDEKIEAEKCSKVTSPFVKKIDHQKNICYLEVERTAKIRRQFNKSEALSYEIDIKKEGTYQLSAMIGIIPDKRYASDSFFVKIDDQKPIVWPFFENTGALFYDFLDNWGTNEQDICFQLSPGIHKIYIAPREPGARLDWFKLIYLPSGRSSEHNAKNDTLLLLHFDKDLVDSSSHHNKVVSTGKKDWKKGKVNDAIFLNGENYLKLPGFKRLQPLNSFCVEAWVKIEGKPENMSLINCIDKKNKKGFVLKILKQKPLMIFYNTYNQRKYIYGEKLSETVMKDWIHFTGIYDGEKIKILVNNTLSGQAKIGQHKLPKGIETLYIGGPSDSFFLGCIDEVKISGKAEDVFESTKLTKGQK